MAAPTFLGVSPAVLNIRIAQGEVIADTVTLPSGSGAGTATVTHADGSTDSLAFPNSFGDLSAATIEAQATITHADATTTTLDLLPTLGGTGSRVVSFGILTATTAAATAGSGTWDLFITESGGDPVRYIAGTLYLDASPTK